MSRGDGSPPIGFRPRRRRRTTAAYDHVARADAAGYPNHAGGRGETMAIPIPGDVRQILDAPNYVHLSTLRADGSPRNWVVWVGLEDDYILVCTSDAIWKAKDMRRDPRVACRSRTWQSRTVWPRFRAGWRKYVLTRAAATWTRSQSSTRTRHSRAAARIACAS